MAPIAYTAEQLHEVFIHAMDAASAPPGSARYKSVPDIVRDVMEKGDEASRWVLMSTFAAYVMKVLGLDQMQCTCGEHELEFGLAPVDENGQPQMDQAFFGPTTDIPDQFANTAPEAVAFIQMVNAEATENDELSREIWLKARQAGYAVGLFYVAVEQAGAIRREQVNAGFTAAN